MQRNAGLLPILFAAIAVAVPAQTGIREQPPLYRGPTLVVDGVFVTPIPGAPFTAAVLIRSEQPMADGSVEAKQTVSQIARDSRGRIRNERHLMVPESYRGTPPLLSVHLFDPATRVSYLCNPATLIARQQVVPPHEGTMDVARGAKTEDLGFVTLEGLQTKGTRFTRTVPAQASGTGKPVEVVDEFWYSEDLHMNLLERHTDLRGGVQTVGVSDIKREEPAPALFEVPEGYKIVDMTPPAGAPAARGHGVGSPTQ
jgi:hypothetical protein